LIHILLVSPFRSSLNVLLNYTSHLDNMSDSETPGPSHPTHGGKSLQSLERPRYKSWRKKYRKMRYKFDGVLEENKRLFKEEQRLEGIAKRLKEELDGLLELCLDLNQQPSLPPELRYELSYTGQPSTGKFIEKNITPEVANRQYLDYQDAVKKAMMPGLDLEVARAQMEERLAAQETEPLATLESRVSHPVPTQDTVPEDEEGMGPGYLTSEQECEYLARVENQLQREPMYIAPSMQKKLAADPGGLDEKHWAELTPREVERQVELLNPQSQHNWLKIHKINSNTIGENDDNESLASHEASKPPRKRGGKDKNLAKQVGDRAVERAKEGWSPSAASDEDAPASAGGKRKRDPDATYRVKGAKSSASKGSKRKRSGGEDLAAKRRRVDGDEVEENESGYAMQ
jgi:hypothetical protein